VAIRGITLLKVSNLCLVMGGFVNSRTLEEERCAYLYLVMGRGCKKIKIFKTKLSLFGNEMLTWHTRKVYRDGFIFVW